MVGRTLALLIMGWILLMIADQVWADERHSATFICCSWHHDRSHDYNEQNYGAMYMYKGRKVAAAVGTFKNSFDEQATFVGVGRVWTYSDNVKVSLIGGLTTGYSRATSSKETGAKVTPFILPTIHLYDRVNIHTIPGVVYAVSFDVLKW